MKGLFIQFTSCLIAVSIPYRFNERVNNTTATTPPTLSFNSL